MQQLHLVYAVVGSLALVLAGVSSRIRSLPVSEPLLALAVGVLIGPQVLSLVEIPEDLRSRLLLEGARTLLAVSLIGVALRYPARRLRSVVAPTAVLVTVGMVGMAALSALLAWWLLPVTWSLALLIGACISPTDPVLASSVVTGGPAERGLPAHTRQLLSEESGTNDGLALPLVVVGVALALGESVGRAALVGAYQIAVGVAVGLVIGAIAGRAVNLAERRSDVDEGSSLVFTLVLAIAVLGITRLLHADGILAVFVAGLAYNFTVRKDEVGPQNTIDEAVNRYLVLPLFLLLGVELPWSDWRDLGWTGVVLPLAVLLLRRWPVLLVLKPVLGLRLRDAVFVGWFGPIGVSALFYLTFSEDEGVRDPMLWAAGSLVVAASTLVHGITSAPGRVLYQRAAGRSAQT